MQFACQGIITKLLPILDNFELAIQHKDNKEEFVKGIELIYAELNEILHQNGLKVIETEGKKFDPCFHEALMSEKSDKEEGTILEEFQKGYMINDKVLRHSKVKISGK